MRSLCLLVLALPLPAQILRCGDVGCFTNPMTTAGDLIVGGAAGVGTRLGASTGYLHWNGSAFVYDTPPSGSLPTGAAGVPYYNGAGAWTNNQLLIMGSGGPLQVSGYSGGGGIAQAQTVTLAACPAALAVGQWVFWLPAAANTGAAPTLAVCGFTAKPITKLGTTALVANDLTSTAVAWAIYDGAEYQLQNPQTATGGGGTYTAGLGLQLIGSVFSIDTATAPLLSSSNTWTNTQTTTGVVDNSGASHTLVAKKGLLASIPATCTTGEEYFATDAAAGQNKYLCTATNVWTQQAGGGSSAALLKHIKMATYSIGAASYSCAPDQANSTYLTTYTGLTCNSSNFGGSTDYFQFAQFPDTGTPGIELLAGYIPSSGWTGNLTLRTRVTADAGGSGISQFKVATACLADNASVILSYNADQLLTLTVTSAQYKFGNLSLTTTGCNAGNSLYVRIVRDNTVGSNYSNPVFIPDMEIYQ